MKLKQISVFLENKPGQLTIPCRALARAEINIRTLSVADTREFGILRLIVREWEKAVNVLEDAGCVVKTTDVLAVQVRDEPGGLAEIMEIIDSRQINVEYMYAFAYGHKGGAVLIFRFDDVDAALTALQDNKIGVLDNIELLTE